MNQRGFTLIEMISVMLILGILVVVVAPRFMSFNDGAERKTLVAVMDELNTQEKMAFLDCKLRLDCVYSEQPTLPFDDLRGLTLTKNDDGGVVVFDGSGGGTHQIYRWTTDGAARWYDYPQPEP